MADSVFSPYAPIRLRNEIWWRFAVRSALDGLVMANGQIASSLPEIIMNGLITPMMTRAQHFAAEDGDDSYQGQLFAKLLLQRQWVPMVAQYHLCGKQIFDLDDKIVSMLRNTDVSDCTLHDWHPPYDAFFVRFGKQVDMKLQFDDGYEYLDGVFIAVTPLALESSERRLKIGLTTVKDDGSGVMMPGYFIDFTPEEQHMSPLQAVDSFISRKFAELDSDEDNSAGNKVLTEIRKDELKEGADLLRKATELVVNCLFYIESIGADRPLSPGRDVPADLHVKWEQSPQLRRFKVGQKIGSEGYALVRMMGDEIATGSVSVDGNRADVSTHWRKGHWRRQPHGPNRSLIKRVWLRPVLVNASKPHDELPGHVYAVGSTGSPLH